MTEKRLKAEQIPEADKILDIVRSMPPDARKPACDFMYGFRAGMDFQITRQGAETHSAAQLL